MEEKQEKKGGKEKGEGNRFSHIHRSNGSCGWSAVLRRHMQIGFIAEDPRLVTQTAYLMYEVAKEPRQQPLSYSSPLLLPESFVHALGTRGQPSLLLLPPLLSCQGILSVCFMSFPRPFKFNFFKKKFPLHNVTMWLQSTRQLVQRLDLPPRRRRRHLSMAAIV